QIHEYGYLEAPDDIYDAEVQMLPPAEYERSDYRVTTGRNLVQSYPLPPPTRQNQLAASEGQAYRQRTTEYPLRPARPPKSASLATFGIGNGNELQSSYLLAVQMARYP